MSKFHRQLHGFAEFDNLLKQLPGKVENRVLQNATMAAARAGVKTIKTHTPAHADEQSPASKIYGPGRKNIRAVMLKKARRNKGQRGARIDTGNAFWLVFYDLGTRFQAAKPFFARAFQSAHDTMLNVMAERLRKGIEKEVQKLRKIN